MSKQATRTIAFPPDGALVPLLSLFSSFPTALSFPSGRERVEGESADGAGDDVHEPPPPLPSFRLRFTFRHTKNTWEGVPMIAANMDTTGTFEMVKALSKHKVLVALSKHYQPQEFVDFLKANPECSPFMAISSGTSESDFTKLKETVSKTDIKMLCLDVANGYSEHFVEYVRKVRKEFPDHIILAGNVVTGEMTEELILSGADIVKVGIGPGSVCTTRKQTGVGYPQVTR